MRTPFPPLAFLFLAFFLTAAPAPAQKQPDPEAVHEELARDLHRTLSRMHAAQAESIELGMKARRKAEEARKLQEKAEALQAKLEAAEAAVRRRSRDAAPVEGGPEEQRLLRQRIRLLELAWAAHEEAGWETDAARLRRVLDFAEARARGEIDRAEALKREGLPGPEEIQDMLRRAARWYREWGMEEEARLLERRPREQVGKVDRAHRQKVEEELELLEEELALEEAEARLDEEVEALLEEAEIEAAEARLEATVAALEEEAVLEAEVARLELEAERDALLEEIQRVKIRLAELGEALQELRGWRR